ncbi:MAG: WbuC family cupin fold metalloprotein [Gammaproteobacteria bacterium]|nr:WbuC family cupin fold metalloprotein [Gammaproteobacteria bacterium]
MKIIDQHTIVELCDKARASDRRRAHLNFHPQLDDPVQRLAVAIEPDSYIRPHRHPEVGKWELFTVLRGRFMVYRFDEKGTVLNKELLTSTDEADAASLIEMPAGSWHCVMALDTGSVFFEVKPGPYTPLDDKDFASWAPAEGSAGVSDFMQWLKQAEVGDYPSNGK